MLEKNKATHSLSRVVVVCNGRSSGGVFNNVRKPVNPTTLPASLLTTLIPFFQTAAANQSNWNQSRVERKGERGGNELQTQIMNMLNLKFLFSPFISSLISLTSGLLHNNFFPTPSSLYPWLPNDFHSVSVFLLPFPWIVLRLSRSDNNYIHINRILYHIRLLPIGWIIFRAFYQIRIEMLQ